MKIVDTLAEQSLLETLLETTKPPVPPECRHLHYLLTTPFRYAAPYPSGSRFRRAGFTPGVFYGSTTVITAVAELAFHRLLFFTDSPDTPWPADAGEYTVFSIRVRASAGLNLTAPPLNADSDRWTHPTDYTACQALADAAREVGVDALRYGSARVAGGVNVALLSCRGISSRNPLERQTWRIHLSTHGARASCGYPDRRLEFARDAFARDPRIARLRWDRQGE
jgi:hypothetical protein